MRLHPQLSLLVAVAIAPVLVLAVAAGVLLVRHERQTMEQEAVGRTQSAMSAVEAEIRGHFGTLQALVASKSLEAGDTAAFYEETQRVLRGQPALADGTARARHRDPALRRGGAAGQ